MLFSSCNAQLNLWCRWSPGVLFTTGLLEIGMLYHSHDCHNITTLLSDVMPSATVNHTQVSSKTLNLLKPTRHLWIGFARERCSVGIGSNQFCTNVFSSWFPVEKSHCLSDNMAVVNVADQYQVERDILSLSLRLHISQNHDFARINISKNDVICFREKHS